MATTPFEPPPTPGTDPFDRSENAPAHTRYREAPDIARQAREAGRVAFTEGARQARTDAVAVDVCAAIAHGADLNGSECPIGLELIGGMRANLAERIAGAPGRAEAIAAMFKARHRVRAAEQAAARAAAAALAIQPPPAPEEQDGAGAAAPDGAGVGEGAPPLDAEAPADTEDVVDAEDVPDADAPDADAPDVADAPDADAPDVEDVPDADAPDVEEVLDGVPDGAEHVIDEDPGADEDAPDDMYGAYGSLYGPDGEAEPQDDRPALLRDPDYPITGMQLTHPALPIAAGCALVLFEATLGARAIQPITSLGDVAAMFAAGMLVVVLTLAADATGRLVAPLLMRLRRTAALAILTVLAVAMLGCIAWTVTSFGGARETNIAYQDARSVRNAPRGVLNFGSPSTPEAAADALNRPIEAPQAPTGPAKPDAEFAIPLTLVALFVTFLLSTRCSLAEPWRKRLEDEAAALAAAREQEERERRMEEEAQQREDAEHARVAAEQVREIEARAQIELAAREARMQLTMAQQEVADSNALLDANDLQLTALAGREVAFTQSMLARFETEVARVCAINGLTAPSFTLPPVPEAHELLAELVQPTRFVVMAPVVQEDGSDEPTIVVPPPPPPPSPGANGGGPQPQPEPAPAPWPDEAEDDGFPPGWTTSAPPGPGAAV